MPILPVSIWSAILDACDEEQIGLPAPTPVQAPPPLAETLLSSLEIEMGEAAQSDYYRSSRERFLHIIGMTMRHVPSGGLILDVGNAPGYLGRALHDAGYVLHGVNLSAVYDRLYPSETWMRLMNVVTCDVESATLPYDAVTFDAIVFTEVLEHIAITDPARVLDEFKRVLKPGGVVILSTPNVCNRSNVMALIKGENVFWAPKIFYGSTDRHNREYSPNEVRELFDRAGYNTLEFYGVSDHANWRTGAGEEIYHVVASTMKPHALLRNTIAAVFQKSGAP